MMSRKHRYWAFLRWYHTAILLQCLLQGMDLAITQMGLDSPNGSELNPIGRLGWHFGGVWGILATKAVLLIALLLIAEHVYYHRALFVVRAFWWGLVSIDIAMVGVVLWNLWQWQNL